MSKESQKAASDQAAADKAADKAAASQAKDDKASETEPHMGDPSMQAPSAGRDAGVLRQDGPVTMSRSKPLNPGGSTTMTVERGRIAEFEAAGWTRSDLPLSGGQVVLVRAAPAPAPAKGKDGKTATVVAGDDLTLRLQTPAATGPKAPTEMTVSEDMVAHYEKQGWSRRDKAPVRG